MIQKRNSYVHEWFRDTAVKYPDRPAIVTTRGCISYRELLDRSSAIAATLSRRAQFPGGPVVVFTDNRVDMIAGLIGTLCAGSAFVPLTPDLPDARLAEMAGIAEPFGALIKEALLGRYTSSICQDARRDTIKTFESLECISDFTLPDLRPDHLCYIYFTSGSTGGPKGIAGQLKAIDHFIRWEIQQFGFQQGIRVSQLIAPSFDAFLRDVFVPLCSGGTICVPPSEGIIEGEALADWIDEQEINLIHCVPSLFRTLFPVLAPERFRHLSHVLLSGEPLRPSDVAVWQSVFGARIALVNLYGPSETTMTKLFHVVSEDDQYRRSVPIGKPIPGAAAFVADENGRPTSSVGEICIRTAFCSAGYYRRPDLSELSFVKNPLGTDDRDVIYKTGDIGRVLEDGSFEFLGRRDSQIKLRGVRVDLNEVDNALVGTALVHESVAAVHEEGDRQLLCAYVVLKEGAHVSQLRDVLRNRIPDSMVPSVFIPLERIPTLPNGKADRSSLPHPLSQVSAPDSASETLNPIEEIIAGVWRDLLRVPSVRRQDSFFELGGHSLLAAQAASRMALALEAEIPLRLMLQTPRLGDLAREVETLMKSDQKVSPREIARVDRSIRLPLSFAQQRLWFIDQLEPANAAYNLPVAARLCGELNLEVLRAAVTETVRRHEVLRTSFPAEAGEPEQRIGAAEEVEVPLVDLVGLRGQIGEAAARRLAEEEAARCFDLSTGPLLRAMVVRKSNRDHVLVVVMHHIVSDAWSAGVLIRELSLLYEAYREGREPSPLEELSIQYADYAVWQREWLKDEVLEEQLDYWRKQLEGMERLELPTDRARTGMGTNRAEVLRFEIEEEVVEELKELSRREGVTLFMTLAAGFQVLLSRYTGQREVAMGTVVANRNRVEIEGIVGLVANTVVLKGDLSGRPSFRELLETVRRATIGAYTHQEMPFERLVEQLEPDRDPSQNPIFQVAFAFQNAGRQALKLPGIEVTDIDLTSKTSKFDMTVTFSESDKRIAGHVEYNAELFNNDTVERMANHLRNIFKSATEEPDVPLTSIRMLSDSEHYQLTSEWNSTWADYPRDRCVHQLFEEQAARTPDAPALVYGTDCITYESLNRRANQLARHLRKMGIGAEARVGVCLERGVNLVVALAGILKAGAAYVPLDTGYPHERLAYMLQDAQVAVLISRQELLETFRVTGLFLLDVDSDLITRESVENLETISAPENLAYVMYTSGSTGKPKGIGIPHRAISRLVLNTDYIRLDSRDRVAQASNSSFDAATFEVWGALLNGSTLIGVSEDVALSPRRLSTMIKDQHITTIFLTTALFNQIATEQPAAFRGMKQVLFGGEAVDANRVRALLRAGGGPERLLHVYGPTESTTFATWMLVKDVEAGVTTVPIGRPISNTQLYILDCEMHLTPVGVYGEIHIAGDGLARGYANRPELTAEKFVPHPYSEQDGQRLYRTGDIARYLPDGSIEFLGRRDSQVKMRGFRIELAEIETVLSEHPAIRKCAVVARQSAGADKQLVSYVVAARDLGSAELRAYARQRLPEYMVPAIFVSVDDLPLTPNGKVDRAALAAPDQERILGESEYLAPQTESETMIAAIWSELLGMDRIGINDNFFDLGGHSLLAMRLASRARAAFGIELPLRAIFEHPTIGRIAEVIDSCVAEEKSRPHVALSSGADDLVELDGVLCEIERLSDEEARIALQDEHASYLSPRLQTGDS